MEHEERPLKRKERRELERQNTRILYTVDSAVQALIHVGFEIVYGAKHQKFSHPVTKAFLSLPYRSTQSTLSNALSDSVHELVREHRAYSPVRTKRRRE